MFIALIPDTSIQLIADNFAANQREIAVVILYLM